MRGKICGAHNGATNLDQSDVFEGRACWTIMAPMRSCSPTMLKCYHTGQHLSEVMEREPADEAVHKFNLRS